MKELASFGRSGAPFFNKGVPFSTEIMVASAPSICTVLDWYSPGLNSIVIDLGVGLIDWIVVGVPAEIVPANSKDVSIVVIFFIGFFLWFQPTFDFYIHLLALISGDDRSILFLNIVNKSLLRNSFRIKLTIPTTPKHPKMIDFVEK